MVKTEQFVDIPSDKHSVSGLKHKMTTISLNVAVLLAATTRILYSNYYMPCFKTTCAEFIDGVPRSLVSGEAPNRRLFAGIKPIAIQPNEVVLVLYAKVDIVVGTLSCTLDIE